MNLHFPSFWNIHDGRLSHVGTQQSHYSHGTGRAFIGDFGCLGNVYIRKSKRDFDLNFQTNLCSFKKYCNPFYFEEDKTIEHIDYVNEHLFIANRETNLNKQRHQQLIVDNYHKYNNSNNTKGYINGVKKSNTFHTLEKNGLENVSTPMRYAAENYADLFTKEKLDQLCSLNSPIYSGGCIKSFILNGLVFIARCTGAALDILCVEQYFPEKNHIERVYTYEKKESENTYLPIFEIDYLVVKNECRLLVRQSNILRLFIMRLENGVACINDAGITFDKLEWLCGRFGYTNEIATTTSSDEIILYDICTDTKLWSMKSQCLSPVIDSWNELKPLSPMKWIYSNRAHCNIVDCRKNPFSSAQELFSSRNFTLSKDESFSHTSDIFNEHYFYLFSSFNANLIDIRIPGRSVSQWPLTILSPISYSSIVKKNNFDIIIGSQMNATHSIFNQQFSPRSRSTCLLSDDSPGEQPMSLGLTTIYDPEKSIVTVLTLDHHAKILCHKYGPDSQSKISMERDEPNKKVALSKRIFQLCDDDLINCVNKKRNIESISPCDDDFSQINEFLIDKPKTGVYANTDG